MAAMILLGVNCGLGNTDLGMLPVTAFDVEGGWLEYPRQKTGIARRIPLWPETVNAVRTAIEKRPQSADNYNLPLHTAALYTASFIMGIGKASVYKYIPNFSPQDVGAVGGLVGLLGALGGLFLPSLFGILGRWSGAPQMAFLVLLALTVGSVAWLQLAVLQTHGSAPPYPATNSLSNPLLTGALEQEGLK